VLKGGVLEGIGEEIIGNDPAQPLDILALEETTSNPLTVAPIVNGLNSFYGIPSLYSNSTYPATESGGNPGSGNGPNAIVFNTHTLQLLASAPVDPAGRNGQFRRRQLRQVRRISRSDALSICARRRGDQRIQYFLHLREPL